MNLADFRRFRDSFCNICSEIANISETVGFSNLSEQARSLIRRICEERFYLAVIGEIKRGKSTLINAVLGKEILPKAAVVCTATLCVIKYGKEPLVRVFYRSGVVEAVDPTDLKKIVTKKNEKVQEINYVEIGFPLPLLEQGVVIVDTPGVNDTDEWRRRVTEEFIPRSDGVIFVLNAGQPLSRSELDFFAQEVMKYSIEKIWFVVNGIDRIENPNHRAEAIEYCAQNLRQLLPSPKLFPISAKLALEGKLENNFQKLSESGVPAFFSELESELLKVRRVAIFDVPLGLLENLISDLERGAFLFRDLLNTDKERLNKQQKKICDDMKRAKSELMGTLDLFESRIEALVFEQVNDWRGKISENLFPQVIRILRTDDPNERKTFELSLLLNQVLERFLNEFFRELHEKSEQETRECLTKMSLILTEFDKNCNITCNVTKELEKPKFLIEIEKPALGIEGRSFISSFGRLSSLVFLFQGNVVLAGLSILASLVAGLKESDAETVHSALLAQIKKVKLDLLQKILSERKSISQAYRKLMQEQVKGFIDFVDDFFHRSYLDLEKLVDQYKAKEALFDQLLKRIAEFRQIHKQLESIKLKGKQL